MHRYWVMEFTAGLSIITNCALMGLISNEMHVLLPAFIENMAVDGSKCVLRRMLRFIFLLLVIEKYSDWCCGKHKHSLKNVF